MLSVALLSIVATGCYRSTGLQRAPLAAEVIPETGGDRVYGLKATAGPGDYYLGNDFVQIAIDGTPYGNPLDEVLAGARSGGSIVDAGVISLDTSYRRISVHADIMHRLTPVVNQNPDLELVFDQYVPKDLGDTSVVVMQGYLLDPKHTIAGATWDAAGKVAGVTVTHTVSLGTLDRFYGLQTIITNNSGATLGIRNIGDYLAQQGGGYRLVVPATADAAGAPLAASWGAEIPGNSFLNPLASAVKAPMVAMLNAEPGSVTMDSHASAGLLPVDADNFLVNADQQKALTELRPVVPARMVVGGNPVASLASGASLTHNRRLYLLGGQSITSSSPTATASLFNMMDRDRFTTLRVQDYGVFQFDLTGTASRQGPLPAEVRIERQVGTSAAPAWELARVEWMEPTENSTSADSFAASTIQAALPAGTYRVVVRNKDRSFTKELFTNINVDTGNASEGSFRYIPETVKIEKDKLFLASSTDVVAPEAPAITDANGNLVSSLNSIHLFSTHERDSPLGNLQPARITLVGTQGTADPVLRRLRTLATYFDPINKAPQLASGLTPGQYQFRGGNEMFGTGFTNYTSTMFAWLPNPPTGTGKENTYLAYATRGPLSNLETEEVSTFEGQTQTAHSFTFFPMAVPAGWTSFDMPGPSQATTGGFLPAEKLASALAEGVQAVANTELDLQSDAQQLYTFFRAEFLYLGLSDAQRPLSLSDILRTTQTWGAEPFVVSARSTELAGFGTVAALFTPDATAQRNGGARRIASANLADFLKQGQGQFNVVTRPRGPQGLFTVKGFNRAVALGVGVNAWWNETGPYAFGKRNGDFEALELLRAEGFNGASPDAWFAEFKQVRADWFALLNQQTPANFTKGLGLSSALFSLDTPVGLARTYIKASPTAQTDLSSLLSGLQSGALVASTGPFLDVKVGSVGPGGLVTGSNASVTLSVSLTKTAWMPVEELRVVINGTEQVLDLTKLAPSSDPNVFTGSYTLTMPAGKDAWIVVQAGVPFDTTAGVYKPGTVWNQVMRGIYPIAVSNPIFVDVNGGGYSSPGL